MADAAATPAGWAGVFGALDGISGAADRIGGIVNTVADGAEDVARGRRAIHDEQADKAERELDLALKLQGFERGDNKLQMIIIGACAVALILILK